MGKLLGIDYGEKRVGISLTDEDKKYAFGEETIAYNNERELIERLKAICQSENIEKIIIGWPLNLKGEKTKQTIEVEKFSARLKKELGLSMDFQDERLTSRLSLSLFKESKKAIKPSKNQINTQAARIILQDYLDRSRLNK